MLQPSPIAPHSALAKHAPSMHLALRLRIWWERLLRFEYWPTWAVYLCILPALTRFALRHRSTSIWAACNPGIPACGGLMGERKHHILQALDAAEASAGSARHVLAWHLIPADPDVNARLRTLDAAMERLSLNFPIILKPDIGERGYALKLARSRRDAQSYLASVTCDVLAQRFDPGPHECGVLWVRSLDSAQSSPNAGFLYSITAKEFPVLVGDGERTLEALILAHPRFRRQQHVFLSRFQHERTRVLASGERFSLGVAGNHCQGTLFRDGAHLITPQLTSAIDAIARRFGDPTGQHGTLDFARFDIRYSDEASLARGEGFRIVEMNGLGAESTNIYDPEKPIRWSLRVLAAQWELLFALGAQRVRHGAPRPSATSVLRVVRDGVAIQAQRGGSALAD